MKIKYHDIITKDDKRTAIRSFYERKYYGIWLNSFRFPELSEEQNHYIMKQFWKNGRVLAFTLLENVKMNELQNIKPTTEIYEGNLLILTPLAENYFNIYDFATSVTPINTRGATYIPQKRMTINKDAVEGFAHITHSPVRDLCLFYINRIVDIEMTISTNLFVHKLPRLVVVSPEDKKRVEEIMTSIEEGENKIFLDAEDYQAIKNVLDAGGSYIIDKLYQYKQSLENELLTLLGVDNIGLEKRERLIVDEANSNNDLINDYSDCFMTPLKAFCKNVTEKLNYKLSVIPTSSPVVAESSEKEEEQEGESDNGNQ